MAEDLENIGNALDSVAVHELFERESVLARAGEQRDDLSALLPVMKSRAGDAAFMERARTGDRPGPFFERRLSRLVGEAAATLLKVDQFSTTSALARFAFGGVGTAGQSGWRISARPRGSHVGDSVS